MSAILHEWDMTFTVTLSMMSTCIAPESAITSLVNNEFILGIFIRKKKSAMTKILVTSHV